MPIAPLEAIASNKELATLNDWPHPFYIYAEVQTFFDAACNRSLHAFLSNDPDKSAALGKGYSFEMAGEVLFPRHLASHPLRTTDPKRAHSFVVPAYLGLNGRGLCNHTLQNLGWLRQFLTESAWFQRYNGTDHVLLSLDHAALMLPLAPTLNRMCLATQPSTTIFYHKSNTPPENMVAACV